MGSGDAPHDQSEEHRRANLRAAGFSHARSLLAGDNFDLVADRLRRGAPGFSRLDPINVRKALGDLHSPKEIQDAVRFTKRLLEAGQRRDLAETDAPSRLEREYPGFSKNHYLQAADLGWWMTR